MKVEHMAQKNVCDWCKSDKDYCYHKCFLCGKDVCHSCQEQVGMEFRYSFPYVNKVWICGECQEKNKDDYLLGMLWQMNVLFNALSTYRETIDKMAKKLNMAIANEMQTRGLSSNIK